MSGSLQINSRSTIAEDKPTELTEHEKSSWCFPRASSFLLYSSVLVQKGTLQATKRNGNTDPATKPLTYNLCCLQDTLERWWHRTGRSNQWLSHLTEDPSMSQSPTEKVEVLTGTWMTPRSHASMGDNSWKLPQWSLKPPPINLLPLISLTPATGRELRRGGVIHGESHLLWSYISSFLIITIGPAIALSFLPILLPLL